MDRPKQLDLAMSVAVAAAIAALVAMSFWTRWSMLTGSPFPVGIDGYFYPIQLRSPLDHGTLAYPASPLAFWLMAPLAAITDPMTGAKLGAALFGALIAVPAYGVGARLGKSRGAGLIAAALATTSAGSAFLTIEFVKNGIGLTVGLTALWLVLRALETRKRLRIFLAIAAVTAAFLTHKMAAGLVLLIAIPAAIAEAANVGELRGRRLLYLIGALGGIAVLVAILGVAFPERFLSPDDLTLVRALWAEPRWELPALATPRAVLPMGYEALIGAMLGVLAAISLVIGPRIRTPGERIASWVIVGLALLIALPWLSVGNPQGLGFRIRIVAFLPMALCAAIVAREVLRIPLPPWQRDAGLAILALVIVLAMPRDRTQGRILAHPAMVAAVEGLTGRIPEGGIAIVPERHIAFMVTWYTGVPNRQRPEGVPRDKRWRVMPLAFIGAGSLLDEALMAARHQPGVVPPIGTHPRHPNGLVLVAEPTWDWILTQLPPEARAYFERWPTI
ncbi:hypothetical protein BH11MYX3_BH11MYX3_44520 [soil metagenome]